MKTKSKLVLGLSILSAATLAAGATSTFAWYQAETAIGTVSGSADTNNLAAVLPSVDATVNLNVTASIAPVDGDSTPILALYSTDHYLTKYKNTATGGYVEKTGDLTGHQVYSKAYSVSIEVADGNVPTGFTKTDVVKLIREAGVKFSVAVDATLEDGSTANPFASRTVVWTSASALSDNAAPGNNDAISAQEGTAQSQGTLYNWDGTEIIIGYFCLYIDGQNSGSDTDDGTVVKNTHLTVTVEKFS